MVQLSGKYELVKSENFAEYLIGIGLPEEQAKKADSLKPIYEIKQDGDKITLDVVLGHPIHIELILNKEVDEVLFPGITVKTTAVLEGDVLTLSSKTPKGRTGKRIHKFAGDQVTVTYKDDDPKTPVATRVFKKL